MSKQYTFEELIEKCDKGFDPRYFYSKKIVNYRGKYYYSIGKELGKATNNIETGRLSKKIGDVYEALHWDKLSSKQFPVETRTNSKGEISSYQLSVDNPYNYKELAKGLCEIFDIEYDKDL